MNIQVHSACV